MIIVPFYVAIIYTLACIILGYLGRSGKFAFWGNFFVSLILTPVIGLLVVLAQDLNPQKQVTDRD